MLVTNGRPYSKPLCAFSRCIVDSVQHIFQINEFIYIPFVLTFLPARSLFYAFFLKCFLHHVNFSLSLAKDAPRRKTVGLDTCNMTWSTKNYAYDIFVSFYIIYMCYFASLVKFIG